jgi:Flp pilus assembly protein TadG
MIVRHQTSRRGGATTVEMAVVVSVFLLFLFGLFEYCRFILMLQATTNACREAARYASVNMDKPSNFDTNAYQDASGNVFVSIVQNTRNRMSGVDKMIVSATPTTYYSTTGATAGTAACKIEVFPCDEGQLLASPPVVAPDADATSWNNASFGARLAVRVSGTYTPVLPNFLLMGSTIPVSIVVTVGAEG